VNKFKSMTEAEEFFASKITKDMSVDTQIKVDSEGDVEAVVSVFNQIDSDGDIVLASAFTDGQEVAMVWSHDWSRPVGKGAISVGEDRATFDGSFFLDTSSGAEAHKIVKNMEGLQEWSWGFKVTDYDIKEDENSPYGYVRIIKDTDLYEVSPVLIGANRDTETVSIKEHSDEIRNIIKEEISNIVPLVIKAINDESLKVQGEHDNIREREDNEAEKTAKKAVHRAVAEYVYQRYSEVIQ